MSPSSHQPAVVVLSGPSGSGKSTVVDLVVKQSTVRIEESISATTRPKRPGEVHGKDYYFLSTEEFLKRRDAGEFLEFAEVHGAGYWYGTLKTELQRIHDSGAHALLEIDVEGAISVMSACPDVITIFLRTPSDAEFERRLRARATESEDEIQRRLATARNELEFADRYRHQVVNDNLEQAVSEIVELLPPLATEPE